MFTYVFFCLLCFVCLSDNEYAFSLSMPLKFHLICKTEAKILSQNSVLQNINTIELLLYLLKNE